MVENQTISKKYCKFIHFHLLFYSFLFQLFTDLYQNLPKVMAINFKNHLPITDFNNSAKKQFFIDFIDSSIKKFYEQDTNVYVSSEKFKSQTK